MLKRGRRQRRKPLNRAAAPACRCRRGPLRGFFPPPEVIGEAYRREPGGPRRAPRRARGRVGGRGGGGLVGPLGGHVGPPGPPRCLQDAARRRQDGLRCRQDASRRRQDGLRRLQDASRRLKMPPRRLKTPPRRPKEAPRRLQDAILVVFWCKNRTKLAPKSHPKGILCLNSLKAKKYYFSNRI